MEVFVFYWLGVAAVFGGFGAWIAREKRRGPGEGLILGFLFGPLGVIVEAVLPSGDRYGASRGSGRGRDRDFLRSSEPDWSAMGVEPCHRRNDVLGVIREGVDDDANPFAR